jgi:SAM-dependent methyltransferase
MIKDKTTWYASWFDTPYYHLLYQERDQSEARKFMDNLTNYLDIPKGGKILDLACGKGRHSRYLNSIGYDVTGVDLSINSITFAKQFENEKLHFDVHNMCKPYNDTFDAIFNLFTSFGYFDNDESNLNTIKAIKADLSDSGFGVIDFMNSKYVIDHLVSEDKKTIDGITFKQKRYLEDGYVKKDILFSAQGKEHNYQERVRAFTLEDFKVLFKKAGVQLLNVFGDYKLRKFDIETSQRLILIFK